MFALDKSTVRSIDADGRLHVASSAITKAAVNPYYGREIPGYKELGLDAEKIYQLFRDPKELKKAVSTFNNIPILSKHDPVTASDHKPNIVCGSTGTDAEFNGEYLTNSLVFWAQDDIDDIQAEEKRELSSAYRYTPVVEPGTYKGDKYDIRMTDIKGNHVALVEYGRAGSDVYVQDSNPFFNPQVDIMKKKTIDAIRAEMALDSADLDKVRALLAMDADKESDEDDEKEKVAEDEDEDIDEKVAEDEDDEDEDDKKKPAQDSIGRLAMDSAIAKAKNEAKSEMMALFTARKAVESLVGEVAMDSADAVYKFALDKAGIKTKGVHASAFPAMVDMLKATKQNKPGLAMDSAADQGVLKKFPYLATAKRSA